MWTKEEREIVSSIANTLSDLRLNLERHLTLSQAESAAGTKQFEEITERLNRHSALLRGPDGKNGLIGDVRGLKSDRRLLVAVVVGFLLPVAVGVTIAGVVWAIRALLSAGAP